MNKSELLEKLKVFAEKLKKHRAVYAQFLNISSPRIYPSSRVHPIENVPEMEEQKKELHRLFAVLEPYITNYSLGRIKVLPKTGGREWDIYREAIGNNISRIKRASLDAAILDLEGIIAKVEAEDKEEVDIIESKDINEEIEERDKKIKIFLSYSNMDKELAGQIKFALEDYELEVFLAHEDIEPSAEWEETIRTKLESCDIFMPILTEHFYKSNWTDQEIGIAIAYNKKIMPIKISVDPQGFISRYQAVRMDITNISNPCNEIVKVIASNPEFGDLFRDALIKKFGDSCSFEYATNNADLLISFSGYTPNQVTAIIKHTISNRQIYESFKARSKLRNLIYDYKEQIDPELLEAFYEAIKPKV